MLPQSLILTATLANSLAAPAQPSLILPPCKFADTYQFESAKCAIEFRNSVEDPIAVSGLTHGSPRDSIAPKSFVVLPHGSAYAEASISPAYEVGRIHRIFRFQSNESNQLSTNRVSEATGFVANVLDDPKPV